MPTPWASAPLIRLRRSPPCERKSSQENPRWHAKYFRDCFQREGGRVRAGLDVCDIVRTETGFTGKLSLREATEFAKRVNRVLAPIDRILHWARQRKILAARDFCLCRVNDTRRHRILALLVASARQKSFILAACKDYEVFAVGMDDL